MPCVIIAIRTWSGTFGRMEDPKGATTPMEQLLGDRLGTKLSKPLATNVSLVEICDHILLPTNNSHFLLWLLSRAVSTHTNKCAGRGKRSHNACTAPRVSFSGLSRHRMACSQESPARNNPRDRRPPGRARLLSGSPQRSGRCQAEGGCPTRHVGNGPSAAASGCGKQPGRAAASSAWRWQRRVRSCD